MAEKTQVRKSLRMIRAEKTALAWEQKQIIEAQKETFDNLMNTKKAMRWFKRNAEYHKEQANLWQAEYVRLAKLIPSMLRAWVRTHNVPQG